MNKLENAIDRIKTLECPTGELENRVSEILNDYRVANDNRVVVIRKEELDSYEAQAYSAKISSDEEKEIVVLAKSGMDDYVAKVVDVYTR